MKSIRRIIHWFAHLFRMNGCRLEIGEPFQPPPWPVWLICATCGKRSQLGMSGEAYAERLAEEASE